jgi:PIN domain nuclease of toxin-antitoxin system
VILLDSNALLWAIVSPSRLGRQLSKRLERLGCAFYSPLSTLELQIAHLKGKAPALPHRLEHLLTELGFYELPFRQIDSEAAARLSQLQKTDPFDWMLVSQALANEADFYTSDMRLLSLGLDFVKDATR